MTRTNDETFVFISAGGRGFCIRSSSIAHVSEFSDMGSKIPGAPAHHLGFMDYQGSPVPVFDLSIASGGQCRVSGKRSVVVLSPAGGSFVGIAADSVDGMGASSGPVTRAPPANSPVTGIVPVEDGKFSMLVDPSFFL